MARPDTTVNLAEKLSMVNEHWSPKTVIEVNGLELKVAKVKGEFVWHDHPEGDELFLVVSGELVIDLEGGRSVRLREGEMFVVPCGMRHRPVAADECQVLLLDPVGVVNTGEVSSELTADAEWI